MYRETSYSKRLFEEEKKKKRIFIMLITKLFINLTNRQKSLSRFLCRDM